MRDMEMTMLQVRLVWISMTRVPASHPMMGGREKKGVQGEAVGRWGQGTQVEMPPMSAIEVSVSAMGPKGVEE